MTDEEIIGLYRSGQKERAFKGIVDAYSERLYWHVRGFVCSHEDTDDLLQEIFIKIWSALPSFRGDSRLFTWIYRIATNETLNWLHKQKIRAALRFESLDASLADKIDDDSPSSTETRHSDFFSKPSPNCPRSKSPCSACDISTTCRTRTFLKSSGHR